MYRYVRNSDSFMYQIHCRDIEGRKKVFPKTKKKLLIIYIHKSKIIVINCLKRTQLNCLFKWSPRHFLLSRLVYSIPIMDPNSLWFDWYTEFECSLFHVCVLYLLLHRFIPCVKVILKKRKNIQTAYRLWINNRYNKYYNLNYYFYIYSSLAVIRNLF